ncbi:MAG: hypothetical protein DCC57_07590 [Chloroflexi bacterium]|nr:MAG: hypothetical protein DCC57_07590 [Chloroflexota bacterium]
MTPAPFPLPPPRGRRTLLNAGALTGSNLWRIAVSFLLQIAVARRLGLEALGHYTLLMAVLNIGQVLSELGLPLLLVRDLARRPDLRRARLRQALIVQGAAALITAAGLVALTALLPTGSPLRPALWWIAASWPLYAALSACETLFQAAERMELLLGVEAAINLLTALASIGVLWLHGTVVHLAAVVALAQVVSVLARQARPFLGLALADVLLQRLDMVLVGLVGGATTAGLYSAAYNLVRVAVKIIQSVWRALYPTLSRLSAQAPARYRRWLGLSLRYGLPACGGAAAVGAVLAAPLLALLYGVLRILLWVMPLFFVESALITHFLVQQRPHAALRLTAAHVAAMALLLPPGVWLGGAVGAAWAALLAQAAGVLVGLLRTAQPIPRGGA